MKILFKKSLFKKILSKKIPIKKQRGFTLLEILIALSIFALISIGSFQLITTTIKTVKSSQRHMQQFTELSNMLNIMEVSLLQSVDRPVRDEFGDRLPAFIGDSDSLEFTHGGWSNRPMEIAQKSPAQIHSTLQRRACATTHKLNEAGDYQSYWLCQYWTVLDRVQHSQPVPDLSIPINQITIRYLSHNKIWHNRWPKNSDSKSLPLAIEIHITSARFTNIYRLYQLGASND